MRVRLHVVTSLDAVVVDQIAPATNVEDVPTKTIVCSIDPLNNQRKRRTATAAMTVKDNVFDDDPNALVERIRRLDQERIEQRKLQIADFERRRIQVVSANRRHRFDPSAILKLARLIRDISPETIHTWDETSYAWCRLSTARNKVPIEKSDICEPNASLLPVAATMEVGLHEQIENRNRFGGIGLGPTRKQFLASLHLPASARLVGTVGPLTTNRRLKDLIWAAELLRVVNDETYLLIVGEGPEEWRLHRFRDQVGVGQRVRMLGARPDYRQWLQHLDFYWSGCKVAPNALVVVEAMSVGIPVIATDIPAYRRVLDSELNGFLVRTGDRSAFAKHTWRMMNNDEEYCRISKAAREKSRTNTETVA